MSNGFEGIKNRIIQRFDQELQEFRTSYFSLNEGERTDFREWLESIASVQANMPQPNMPQLALQLSLRLSVDNSFTNEHGELEYDGGGAISPSTLLKAVLHWDANENYTPKLGEICR